MCDWRAGASQPSRSTGTSPYRNVLRSSKYTSAKFHAHRVSRMRSFDLTGHLYYSGQVCALLVVGLRYTAVLSFACCWLAYTTCTSSCSTPPSFAVH